MLKKLLERGGLVVIVPIVTLFISAIFFGLYGTYLAIASFIEAIGKPEYFEVTKFVPKFFSVIDVYLLAMVFYIFALGLYELFVGKLDVPEWLKIETVEQLKATLASVVVLFVAISFVKVLVDWKNPVDTLLLAASTGIFIVALVIYYKAKAAH
jgi:uncharacterized membrane protein YqhA